MTYQDYEDFVKDYNVLSAKLQNAQNDMIAYAGAVDEISRTMDYYRKNVFSERQTMEQGNETKEEEH